MDVFMVETRGVFVPWVCMFRVFSCVCVGACQDLHFSCQIVSQKEVCVPFSLQGMVGSSTKIC